jgi:hypothetical protein
VTTSTTTPAEARLALIQSAATAFADTFGSAELGHDVGSYMTCSEADTMATLMAVASQDVEAAAQFLAGHAYGDDDPDDTHGPWVPEGDHSIPADVVLEKARAYVRGALLGE